MRIPIYQQRDVIRRIATHPNESSRSISRAIGIASNSVLAIRRAYVQAGLSVDALSDLDDDQWCNTLGTVDSSIAQRKPAPEWNYIHEQMGLADATLMALWTDFRQEHPGGIGYSQFAEGYRLYTRQLNIAMRRTHVPGDKMYCDFCGRTVPIRDPNGGPGFDAQIFIAVLGHSNYSFAHAVASQKIHDWNACHASAFEFFGGTPVWIVSDNLKSAVIRRTAETLVLNKSYRECLTHYGASAAPRRVRKPRDNAKAESAVQYVQRSILFALRNMTFFSLAELNAELHRRIAILNEKPFKKLPGNRRERYERVERASLKPLPAQPFEPREWRFEVLVGQDYVFDHEKCVYSVPCEYRNSRVDLRITATVVEVMHRGKRIAIHERKFVPGELTMIDDHRPISHRRVLEGEPKMLMSWSLTVGPHTEAMFQYHLRDRTDVTNGLRTAQRFRELARQYGDTRFEEVCSYAIPLNMTSLKSIKSILAHSPDKKKREQPARPHPAHPNVRGANYYGDET